jgi:hypothetical protein
MPDVCEADLDLDEPTICRIAMLVAVLVEIPEDRRPQVLRILEGLLAIPDFDVRLADAQAYFRAQRSVPGLRLHDGDTDG